MARRSWLRCARRSTPWTRTRCPWKIGCCLSRPAFLISTVYQWLGYFDIAPVVTQDAVLQLASAVLQILSLLGLIVDPTTAGMGDSARALGYEAPYQAKAEE